MGRPVPKTKRETLNRSYMEGVLDSIAREHFGPSFGVQGVTVEPCGRRLVRYHAQVVEGGKSQKLEWKVMGKIFESTDVGKRSFDAIRRVWDNGFSHQDPVCVRIPEGYSYIPELRLLLMEEIPGQPLKKLMKKQVATPEHMRLFGSAMAKVHRSPLVIGEPFTVEDHLTRRCGALSAALGDAFPGLRDDIRWVVHTALDSQRRENRNIYTLAHGDFHFGQVHLESGDLWILDLDPLHYGDPAYDVAMVFFAFKQIEKKTKQSGYIHALRDAFVSSYFSMMDWQVARRVPLHEAMIHLKRACKRFRWQDEEGWQALIPIQIGQAVTCLEFMKQAKEPRSLADMVKQYEGCPGEV